MSKNTNIAELINYISVDGSGNVVFTTVSAATTNTDKFLVSDTGVLKFRTAAQLLSDIGAQASGSYQSALSGTGFVKISGTTISYDNSTYATETYVGTAVSNLVGAAPSTLDTLNELATALGNDANFATTIANNFPPDYIQKCFNTFSATVFTILALVPINSSRVIPGFLGIPEVITTTSLLAVFE